MGAPLLPQQAAPPLHTRLRLASWNCCRGPFARKAALLAPFAADLTVLQECARPDAATAGVCWAGDNPRQGVAVLAAPGWRVEPLALPAPPPRWMVPFRVSGPLQFTLVAVWVLPLGSSYSRAACEGIDALAGVIGAGPSVLMGDFNANPVFDRPRARFGYAGIEARLSALGCASAWHACHGETPGAESQATYFHTWKRELPMHLDYCFLPREWLPRLSGVEIGGYDAWNGYSDHRPLVVDLTL